MAADLVSSLAYLHKKGGDLGVSLYPRHFNRTLKRPHHKTPTVLQLTHKFSKTKVFLKLDANSWYWSNRKKCEIWNRIFTELTLELLSFIRNGSWTVCGAPRPLK